MPEVLLVRHGESTWNLERRIQGQTAHPELTPAGRRQALRAADELASCGAGTLWSSDAARALQTAELIGARLGLVPVATALLRERHWGVLQGRTDSAAWAAPTLLAGPDDKLGGEGESVVEVAGRVETFLRGLADLDAPAVVVSHGDTLQLGFQMPGTLRNGAVWRFDVPRAFATRPGSSAAIPPR